MDMQKLYNLALYDHDRNPVIAYGAPGSGKTKLAMEAGLKWILHDKRKKLVLCNPAKPYGDEEIGALPGDLNSKMAPWMEPFYQYLEEELGRSRLQEYLDTGRIVVQPLCMVQGRNHDNSFLVLDEAQNACFMQLVMFLTRATDASKVVICGDVNQVAPGFLHSGLNELILFAAHTEFFVHTIKFTSDHVKRGKRCQKLVQALEEWQALGGLDGYLRLKAEKNGCAQDGPEWASNPDTDWD